MSHNLRVSATGNRAKMIYQIPVVNYDNCGRHISGDIASGVSRTASITIESIQPSPRNNTLTIAVTFDNGTAFRTVKNKMENIISLALGRNLGSSTTVSFIYS